MIEASLLLLSALMIVLCGLFVAAEFSFVAAPRALLHKDHSRQGRGLQKALRHLSTHLSSAQIGITLTNLLLGFLAEPALARILRGVWEAPEEVTFLLAFLIANVVTILFGELIPKNLAIARPLETAKAVQGFQRGFSRSIFPLLLLAQKFSNWVLLRIGIEPQEELASARSSEELASLVRSSAVAGTLELPTALLLEQALQFRSRNAADAMTPRSQVESVRPDDNLREVVDLAKRSGHSRFPVLYGEEVCGIIHLRQAISQDPEKRPSLLVEDFLEEALLIPSSFPLHQLLDKLREGGMQVALVLDEFGSFDGLLTLEDLVEEMIGELQDEHDPEEITIREIAPGSWEFSGLLRPDEVFRLTGVHLPEGEEWETVAGLMLYHLQKIPEGKEHVSLRVEGDTKLVVELLVNRMDGVRIDRVHMKVRSV